MLHFLKRFFIILLLVHIKRGDKYLQYHKFPATFYLLTFANQLASWMRKLKRVSSIFPGDILKKHFKQQPMHAERRGGEGGRETGWRGQDEKFNIRDIMHRGFRLAESREKFTRTLIDPRIHSYVSWRSNGTTELLSQVRRLWRLHRLVIKYASAIAALVVQFKLSVAVAQ